MAEGYVNGYIQRNKDRSYTGNLTIGGVFLEGGIEGQYFEKEGKKYLWLKRTMVMEYDPVTQSYFNRKREPQWEAYLEKRHEGVVAYKGTFMFLRFKYEIYGVWDKIFGEDKMRLNLFVERVPLKEQTIIKGINERKRNEED